MAHTAFILVRTILQEDPDVLSRRKSIGGAVMFALFSSWKNCTGGDERSTEELELYKAIEEIFTSLC